MSVADAGECVWYVVMVGFIEAVVTQASGDIIVIWLLVR